MFNRQRSYDMRSWYRSRYSEMISSTSLEDVANSEACRLASQCWEDLARNMQVPDAEVEYDPEEAIVDMVTRWEEYCQTGVVRNDVEELAKDLRDNFHQEIEARRKVAMDMSRLANQGTSTETKSDPQSAQKRKKGQNITTSSEDSAKPPAMASKPSEEVKIDQSIIDLIRPRIMDDIVNEIRTEIGLDEVILASV